MSRRPVTRRAINDAMATARGLAEVSGFTGKQVQKQETKVCSFQKGISISNAVKVTKHEQD